MKKILAVLILLCMFIPFAAYAAYSIDLSQLSDEELDTLIQDITREVLSRKGFSVASPSPTPISTNEILAEEVILEITGGRLYERYDTTTLQLKVKNKSEDYTIDAFDFEVKAFNNYGEHLYRYGIYPTMGFTESDTALKPGKTYANKDDGTYFSLYGLDTATEVQVSINRYHIKDGATVVVPDELRVWITFDLD